MYQIQQITSDPNQQQTIILPDGTSLLLVMRFVPMQYGWFITELTYGTFTIRNVRITVSPNMLYQFKNNIPFGLACFSQDSREPTQQQDFSSSAANLYILTKAEVDQYTAVLSG